MSKMDGLRAMREARYNEAAARAGKPPASAAARPKAAANPAAAKPAPEPQEDGSPALCGHRNMGGKTCTREQGHASKSHRYS